MVCKLKFDSYLRVWSVVKWDEDRLKWADVAYTNSYYNYQGIRSAGEALKELETVMSVRSDDYLVLLS